MTKPGFQKEIIWLKFKNFGKSPKFESSIFTDLAYFNKKTGYLTDDGDLVAEKKLGVKFAQIQGFWLIILVWIINFTDFAYFNEKTGFLTYDGDFVAEKRIRGQICPNSRFLVNYSSLNH